MRPSLHTIAEHRSRRHRRRRWGARPRDIEQATPTPVAPRKAHRATEGPIDQASYACQCGYLFAATVTTTVQCPNCGATQAW